jgi:hypothetical protein
MRNFSIPFSGNFRLKFAVYFFSKKHCYIRKIPDKRIMKICPETTPKINIMNRKKTPYGLRL